jgi:prepilin-type N-terminal cleavage/methylation domain-containing protein
MHKKRLSLLDKSNGQEKDYLAGFTLLEILVSVIILALLVTGLTNVFMSGKRSILHSRSKMTAAELGGYFLDPLQEQVRQDQWGSNCLSSGTGCPGTQALNNITYTPTYTISDVSGTTLRKVKINLKWNETSSY